MSKKTKHIINYCDEASYVERQWKLHMILPAIIIIIISISIVCVASYESNTKEVVNNKYIQNNIDYTIDINNLKINKLNLK